MVNPESSIYYKEYFFIFYFYYLLIFVYSLLLKPLEQNFATLKAIFQQELARYIVFSMFDKSAKFLLSAIIMIISLKL